MSKIYKGVPTKDEEMTNVDDEQYEGEDHDEDVVGQHRQIAGSYFDLTFKPTAKVTYKTVLPQILACISAASFHLPVGLVAAYSAILIPQLETKTSEITVTPEESTWIASLTVLVVPVAALITGVLVDSIGRISTLKIAALPYVLGWAFIASAGSLTDIMVGRILTGFSLGLGTSPAVSYITEVARPDLRGTLICLGPTMTSFGMVLVYIAGWILHWRTVAWLSIGFAILPLCLMHIFSPESPTWLVSQGRSTDALKALKIISQDQAHVQLHQCQLRNLERDYEKKSEHHKRKMEKLLTVFKPSVYKPFLILSVCFFFQQFSGVYILIFYTINFFEDVGANVNKNAVSVLVGLIRMFIGFITSQLLYKLGRRTLILSSVFFMAVCVACSGYFTFLIHTGEINKDDWEKWIPIMLLLLYICVSTTGLLSVPWTMTAEVYPIEVRGVMQGLTVSVAHIIMFAALKSYRTLTDVLGGSYGLQWFFSAVCLLGFVFLYVFLPETRKKTLEEITEYFDQNTIYLRRKSLRVPAKEDTLIGPIKV